MKKTLSLALAVSLTALSLAACGSSQTAATTAAPAETKAEAVETGKETEAAAPAEKIELTVAYADAEDSVFGKGCAAFAEKLEELSGGSMTCTMYPNGTLGSIAEVAAMVQQGTCDVSPIVTSSLVDFCPDLGVFDLPFMFADYESAREMINGEVGVTLAEKMCDVNLHVASWMTMGFREVTSTKPIESIADFNGLKIRTQSNEVHQAIFNSLGAAATVISFSELYTAMEQKTVDAQENPYVNIANNAYYEVQDYLVETNHVFQLAALLISEGKYNSLTDEQKAWVDEAAAYAADVEWKATIEDNEAAKQTCIDKGMTFVTLDHDELLAATSGVYDQYRDKYSDLLAMMNL
ncbi:MAG: DctP family TRAP transporter solute-binding subunit [Eubacteriales bacterium]|nr:DctP family TRAP transporter solute-binding subunit [Eubacteriales bacterium]